MNWLLDNGKITLDNRRKPKRAVRELARYNFGRVWHGDGTEQEDGGLKELVKRVSFGPSPFSRDWDVLLVLDTLRADALQEVAHEYDWLPDEIPATRSPASWSRDWLKKAADPAQYGDVMHRTHAVAWNPFTEWESEPADWHTLEEPWRQSGQWDPAHGLPPREITNRTIRAGRESSADRVFAWYQQPHTPYRSLDVEEPLTHDQVGKLETERETVWDACIAGKISRDEAWNAMIDNLRWVLDDIELLLENLDAEKVVLTADHGEAFGELGGLLWGHGGGMPHPALIRVPWVELSATDEQTHDPEVAEITAEVAADELDERLAALGYK